MQTTFDKVNRDELICRINSLDLKSPARWGKMSASQMLRHCALWEEMVQGNKQYRWSVLGRLFGRLVLMDLLKDEKLLKRNSPTHPDLIVKDHIQPDKKHWISLIEAYEKISIDNFVHPFFGKMTNEQIGYLAFKHTDHHLRQFNG